MRTRSTPARTKGLGFLMADINRLMRKEFDRRVRPLGLTRAQWLFISYLVRSPGCTQSDLAERMQMEKITVSRQAGRLLRGGWINRSDDARDARAYRLYPTAKAVRLNDRLAEMAAVLRADYLLGLPAPRVTALIADLSLIKDNLLRLDGNARQLSA
jgi:MarR family transcriptional regulator, transcriptional regulator for hemolysin